MTTHGQVADEYLAGARKLLEDVQKAWLEDREEEISAKDLNVALQTPLTMIGLMLQVAHVSAIRAQAEEKGPHDA